MASKQVKIKGYPLIPAEERKCIWMTSGFISYKLCDRDYQCGACPFDQALKNGEEEGDFLEAECAEGAPDGAPSATISGSVFYHPDHCWAQVENPESVTIGLDPLLTQLIADIRVVILPRVGSLAGQGECCAHLVQENYILPITAPLSGTVRTINPRLKGEPGLVTAEPRGGGWLITMKPENLESDLKNLLFGRKARLWYQKEEQKIIAHTESILKHDPAPVGPTMQDGGERITCLRELLHVASPEQKIQILDFTVTRARASRK